MGRKGHLSPLPSFPLQQVLLGSFPGLDHISFLEALEPVSENVTFWLWERGQKDFIAGPGKKKAGPRQHWDPE